MIPAEYTENLVEHVVLVHQSVGEFSTQFLQKLRRSNYVTPKNYLDFINTYSKLLDEKTQFNIGETWERGGRWKLSQLTRQDRSCDLFFKQMCLSKRRIQDRGEARRVWDFAFRSDFPVRAGPRHALFKFSCVGP